MPDGDRPPPLKVVARRLGQGPTRRSSHLCRPPHLYLPLHLERRQHKGGVGDGIGSSRKLSRSRSSSLPERRRGQPPGSGLLPAGGGLDLAGGSSRTDLGRHARRADRTIKRRRHRLGWRRTIGRTAARDPPARPRARDRRGPQGFRTGEDVNLEGSAHKVGPGPLKRLRWRMLRRDRRRVGRMRRPARREGHRRG